MAVARAEIGSVPPLAGLAGWVVDASHHVVITEKGVPPGALGELRYPSEHPDKPVDGDFPLEAAVGEAWKGWIDGLNVGDAIGDFQFWVSTTSGCAGDILKSATQTLNPGTFVALELTGYGPANFWICLMRYVPVP